GSVTSSENNDRSTVPDDALRYFPPLDRHRQKPCSESVPILDPPATCSHPGSVLSRFLVVSPVCRSASWRLSAHDLSLAFPCACKGRLRTGQLTPMWSHQPAGFVTT